MAGPVRTPDNEFTRMMARTTEVNRGRVESPVGGGSEPSVRSAAYGTVSQPVPLTEAERAELDAKAIELGIIPRPEGVEGTNYATLAEAQAAGAPISLPQPAFSRAASSMVSEACAFGVEPRVYPRLPDFGQPGIIDLIRKVIYLDGLEFPLPQEDADEFNAYVVGIVHKELTARLNGALAKMAPPTVAPIPEVKRGRKPRVKKGTEAV